MNTSYLALLRGVNVGGNNMIKMSELKIALESDGFTDVSTYIQSGNVLFTSGEQGIDKLAEKVKNSLVKHFGIDVGVAVFSKDEWQQVVDGAPKWWGKDATWKHNLLAMLKPYDMEQVVAAYGELKPEIEMLLPGEGVLYQSLSLEKFGRTTGGKLAANPIYKRMTIRNYNTATKLLTLM